MGLISIFAKDYLPVSGPPAEQRILDADSQNRFWDAARNGISSYTEGLEEISRLRTALEFYAHIETYEPTRSGDVEPIWCDKGYEARTALGWEAVNGEL